MAISVPLRGAREIEEHKLMFFGILISYQVPFPFETREASAIFSIEFWIAAPA